MMEAITASAADFAPLDVDKCEMYRARSNGATGNDFNPDERAHCSHLLQVALYLFAVEGALEDSKRAGREVVARACRYGFE